MHDAAERRRILLDRRLHGAAARDDQIKGLRNEARLVLSYGQQRLWVLDQLVPASTEYVVPVVLRLTGPLAVHALAGALSGLVSRHEVLRTRYVVDGGEPVQVVDPPAPVDLPVVEATEAELPGVLTRAVATPFDLARGPVLRALAVRLTGGSQAGPRAHVLILTIHHIACDGWSTDIIVRELLAGYQALAAGREAGLAAPAVQYADFAAWQRRQLAGEALARRQEYWRGRLGGLEPLDLPLDRPRTAPRDPRGARVSVGVPADVGGPLLAAGRERGATPYMTLLAAFAALLSRLTGRNDLAVGTPMAGRPRSQLEGTVGFFVNTVVLRLDLTGDPTFEELTDRARAVVLAATEHQDLPFEALVQAVDASRDLSRNPVVDVLFLVEGAASAPPPAAGELCVGEIPVDSPAVKTDLMLALRELGDGSLFAALEYATALFDEPTARRWAGYYLRILQAVAAGPRLRLSQLPLLGPAELAQLAAWNDTAAGFPDATLPELFAARVAAAPEAIAVSSAAGDLSYLALNERACRLAGELRARGVRRGSVVGVCLEREADLVVTLLAIMKAGGAYLPVDPGHPAARIAFVLADAGAAAVVSRDAFTSRLGTPGTPGPPAVLLDRDAAAIAARPADAPDIRLTGDDIAYVIYTSGSTGQPKGVLVPQRGIVNRIDWMQRAYGLQPDDRVLQKTPYTFDVSVWEFFWPLVTGARIVMAPPGIHLDPMALADFAAARGVTHLHFVPSLLDVFLDVNPGFPASVRKIFCSGEALRAATARRLRGRTPAELHNLYGPTEASVDVTYYPVPADVADPVPIGAPIANTSVHILDDELNPVPPGVTGEIWLGGVGLALGYAGRPGLTAERFVPDPFGTGPGGTGSGGRLYRTGDRGRRRPDGQVEYLGRTDHQVKLRGLRIELGEIEAALAGHPAVASAAVTVHQPDHGDPLLACYLVAAAGAPAPDPAALRAHLAERLPAYMIPARFVLLAALPLTSSGKVDRRALPAPSSAGPSTPSAGPSTPSAGTATTAPSSAAAGPSAAAPARSASPRPGTVNSGPSAVQRVIAAAWADALGIAEVDSERGFFEAGGDSMRAIRVVGLLRERGIEVTVQDLFQHQTVGALAAVVRAPSLRADDRRAAPLSLLGDADRRRLPAGLADAYPLSRIQAGMVFEMLGDREVSPYHNVTSYLIRGEGEFSAAAMRAAAQAVAARHEVLRTSFDLTSCSEPVQLVWPAAAVEVAVEDLRRLGATEQRAAIRRGADAERAAPFDLARAPLWRLRVHVTSAQSWWLSMIECHAILDGWSHNSLLTELIQTYRRCRAGTAERPAARDEPATAGTVRFADFVAAERDALESAQSREFWRERLATHARFEIPASWAGPDEATDAVVTVQVPVAGSAALRELAAAAGAPLKSVFLAGYLATLAAFSPERAFFIGLVSNGRLEARGGDEVYGMFLNTVPFSWPPSAGHSWRDLVAGVFAEETALQPHRRYPLTELQRDSAWPLVETTFNYLDFYTVDQQAVELSETIDDSPNEFPLVVTVIPGAVQLTVRTSRVGAAWARMLGETYAAVLSTMAGRAEAAAARAETAPAAAAAPSAPRPRDGAGDSPRDPAERAIAEVWAELLGLARVGIHDDFRALGGHSLVAMRVSARLRSDHGLDVSPHEVLRRRTVAALARQLAPAPDDSVVWLRRDGTGTPLVCVHPGGGGVHWYRELADALDRPVLALQHPAVTDPARATMATEDLAGEYLRELGTALPSGPFQLLGWCGGATVTWEMAGRLDDRDVQVILLDPALEGLAGTDSPQLPVLRRCEELFRELASAEAEAEAAAAAHGPGSRPDGERTGELRRELVALLHVVVDDDRAHAMIGDEPGEGWRGLVTVWRALAEARLAYRFRPLPRTVQVIVGDELADGSHVALSRQPYEDYLSRWRALAAIRVLRVPGTHVGVLRPPHVTELGRLLDAMGAEPAS